MSDELGRLLCKPGDLITQKYRVLEPCSSGSFSNVYACKDTKTSKEVVVKCYKNRQYFTRAAAREIKLMKLLNKIDYEQNNIEKSGNSDKNSNFLFVKYLGSFVHNRHQCVVLERYGQTLYEAFLQRGFRPLNIAALKKIIFKIGSALSILHKNGIVHTDIKLENVLLPPGFDASTDFEIVMENQQSDAPSCCGSGSEDLTTVELNNTTNENHFHSQSQSELHFDVKTEIDVRLIDFGSLANSDKWHSLLVTTRKYRAPEILMGARWGIECDIWSLGVMLVELALGYVDFDAENDLEHLFLIQHMIAPFPEWMINEATNPALKVNGQCAFVCNFINPAVLASDAKEICLSRPPLAQQLNFDDDLLDLTMKMLNPNPFERPTITEVLAHPFFEGC
ncbi:CMGC family protein kinase [Tritrichomonas foetus]|uniref:CMGC family protein kinase n=1 Tax=Tritrichomonas foetus TaxID=1144522 RepID=A0A1J4KZP7_9EUKA|nr:CMGC family protein kinase [Tritrichomonas foetus]|eukprot:OHT16626.1 CMGC family protein kinase [Tritrichomonas foetus]